MAELRVTTLLGFFQNDDNQVNIGDPVEDIMISEYHIIHHTGTWRKFCPDAGQRLHVVLQVIFARKWLRMQICPQVAKIYRNDTPNPARCYRTQPTQG